MLQDIFNLSPEQSRLLGNWLIVGALVCPMVLVAFQQAARALESRTGGQVLRVCASVAALFALVWLYRQVELVDEVYVPGVTHRGAVSAGWGTPAAGG